MISRVAAHSNDFSVSEKMMEKMADSERSCCPFVEKLL
jgi:hypothetical protein